MVSSHDLQPVLPPLLGLRWHNHGILRYWPRAPRTPVLPYKSVWLCCSRAVKTPVLGPQVQAPPSAALLLLTSLSLYLSVQWFLLLR